MRKLSSQKKIVAGALLAGMLSGVCYFGLAIWKSTKVKVESELAVATCGEGNVLSVTVNSFSCK